MIMEVRYNIPYVVLSFLVAIFASYVALDLAHSVKQARGRTQLAWLACGSLAMGFGIWSMHFVGMLAFEMPGMAMAYDIPLMVLSILIAVFASAIALFLVSRPKVHPFSFAAGGVAMAVAIAGMHYTGMYSMRMEAEVQWDLFLVFLSVVIALFASFAALVIALRLQPAAPHRYWKQALASLVMGIAIAGMHYTGMAAATFYHADTAELEAPHLLLANTELTIAVLATTALILGLALASSVVDRAFAQRAKKAEETSRLYREAERAITELQQERDLRDRFVSALAHDLRTPLTTAKMSAQLSMRQTTQPEQVEKLAGKVVEAIERVDQMVQDLLDAHRISAGQALPLEIEDGELQPFLQKIIEDLSTVHGDRFVLLCDEGLHGQWDTRYLRRAIENLCTNAVKYGQENTPVMVMAEMKQEQIAVSVHNHGTPLREEELQNLFRLFHRGSMAQTLGKRGWGLGLTIVKGIAEAHGGEIRVDSRESGTTFGSPHSMVGNVASTI